MSKTLNTLIKIAQKKLDDQTLVLNEYNNKKQAFVDEKKFLLKNIETQINNAKNDTLNFQLAHNYAVKAKAGVLYLDDQLIKIEKIIANEKTKLNQLFLEKKRYEIMLENHLKQQKIKANRKEQATLDDFNSMSFNR